MTRSNLSSISRLFGIGLSLMLSACCTYKTPNDVSAATIVVAGTQQQLTNFKAELLSRLRVSELSEASIVCVNCDENPLPAKLDYIVRRYASGVYQAFGDAWNAVPKGENAPNFQLLIKEYVGIPPPVCTPDCRYYSACGNVCVKRVSSGQPPNCSETCLPR